MSKHIYYNELEPFAARWLENLAEAGHIPAGRVDDRSIADVRAADLEGVTQAHFFAGIGGWPRALSLAGWPEDRPVWTGSCPCQPFSSAGKGKGAADKRHLWPAWYPLIAEHRPPVIFGEQVAGPIARAWIDAVSADLEELGYAVGAADLCAAGVGAPHIRQRLFWCALADTNQERLREARRGESAARSAGGGAAGFALADPESERGDRFQGASEPDRRTGSEDGSDVGGVAHHHHHRREGIQAARSGAEQPPGDDVDGCCEDGLVVYSDCESSRRNTAAAAAAQAASPGAREEPWRVGDEPVTTGAVRGFWHPADWIPCTDGVVRPVEPGTFPLAHGIPGRVGRLRAYGNAIVPQVAAVFVRAVMEVQKP